MRKLICYVLSNKCCNVPPSSVDVGMGFRGNAGGGVGVAADVFVRLAVGFGDVVAVTVVVRLRLFADCC